MDYGRFNIASQHFVVTIVPHAYAKSYLLSTRLSIYSFTGETPSREIRVWSRLVTSGQRSIYNRRIN